MKQFNLGPPYLQFLHLHLQMQKAHCPMTFRIRDLSITDFGIWWWPRDQSAADTKGWLYGRVIILKIWQKSQWNILSFLLWAMGEKERMREKRHYFKKELPLPSFQVWLSKLLKNREPIFMWEAIILDMETLYSSVASCCLGKRRYFYLIPAKFKGMD